MPLKDERKFGDMTAGSEFPSMGATIFFGLTATALVTQGPAPTELANPWDRLSESGFEADPDPVAFASLVAWSFPLQLPDAVLAGMAGPTAAPVEIGPLAEFAQNSTTRPVIVVQDENPTQGTAPARLATGLQVASGAKPEFREVNFLNNPATQDRLIDVPVSPQKSVAVFAADPVVPQATREIIDPVLGWSAWDTASASREIRKAGTGDPDSALPTLRVAIPSEVTGNSVRLREAPDRSADIIMRFDEGDVGLVLEIENDWRLIAFPDVTGWMFAAYLKPIGQ